MWKGFDLPGSPPRPYDVAPAQPNPGKPGCAMLTGAIGLVLLFGTFAAASYEGPDQTLVEGEIEMPSAPDPAVDKQAASRASALTFRRTSPGAFGAAARSTDGDDAKPHEAVSYTPSFELPEGRRALEIELSSDLGHGWLGVATALVHQPTGRRYEFALEQDAYRDRGAAVRATPRKTVERVGNLAPGEYVMRLDPHWTRRTDRDTAPTASITVRTTGSRDAGGCCLCFAAMLVLAPAGVELFRRMSFEGRRWRNSNLG